MITLKENQTNTITYQKETDTPLVTSSYENGYGYNIVIYPTLQNDTSLASITFTTSSTEERNPRWETLSFDISSSTEYTEARVQGLPGTTYNLEVWYGPEIDTTGLIWGTTSTTFGGTSTIWSNGENGEITYNQITSVSTKRFEDRVFISGSVSPIEKKYISSNEQAVYTVYQG